MLPKLRLRCIHFPVPTIPLHVGTKEFTDVIGEVDTEADTRPSTCA